MHMRVLALLLCCSVGALAQTGPTVFGQVTDSTGNPLGNATISVRCDGETPHIQTTHEPNLYKLGSYELVFDGECSITFEAPGYVAVKLAKERYHYAAEEQLDVCMETAKVKGPSPAVEWSPVISRYTASEQAVEYLGMSFARIETELISGKRAWLITFKDVVFKDIKGSVEAPRPFDVSFYIGARSGRLLWAEGRVSGSKRSKVQPIRSDPLTPSEKGALHDVGEVYSDPPVKPPAVTLGRAIQSIGSTRSASGFHGLYVLDSSKSRPKPSPMWAITLYGLPPIQPKGGDPIYMNTKSEPLRFGVDAQTGAELFMTNVAAQ